MKIRYALSACAALASLSLSAPVSAQAQAAYQAGPFPVGNLLDYASADAEGQLNYVSVSNATLAGDSAHAVLHKYSVKDTAGAAGTSAFKLQEGSTPTRIDVTGGDTYHASGFFKLSSAASGQSVVFGLGCYDSSDTWIGWQSTPSLALAATTNWQYAGGRVTVPSNCTHVVDSPKITLSGLAAGETVNYDEAVLAPYRAAVTIGAHGDDTLCSGDGGYSGCDWVQTNTKIGPLQDDKEFWSTSQPLPSSWSASSNNCYYIEQHLPQKQWPLCIIAYKVKETQAQLQSFLAGLPAAQEVEMVWWQEPENDSFSGCTSGGNGANFVCYFGQQSANIRAAAAADGRTPEVLVGDNAMSYQYGNITDDNSPGDETGTNGTDCSFIVPSTQADVFALDYYENNPNGTDVKTYPYREDGWKNWLNCIPHNRPIALNEYGMGCSTTPTDSAEAATLAADDSYLKGLTGSYEFYTWSYWYAGGCQFAGPQSTAKWQSIETENGGG